MKYVISCLVLVSFHVFHPAFAEEDLSCECPKLACDACSFEKGVTFKAQKCGPNKSKMRSCGQPTCIAIDQASAACPNPPTADAGPRPPVVVASNDVLREPASGASERIVAGKIKVIQGSVQIVRADGKTDVVTKDATVSEGDRIISGQEGGAVVNFNGGNKLHVLPETAVEIKEYRDVKSDENRKALLHLLKGKIRNQVGQKYNGKSSYYRITTRGATAGVRGTDFLVAYHEAGPAGFMKWHTRIETLEGKVVLSNLDETESRVLLRGDAVNFVADEPKVNDIAVPRGKFDDLYKIPSEELKTIDKESRMDVARAYPKREVASKKPAKTAICTEPAGDFNQCQWTCANNPKGEKTCRVDLPQVRCVRSRCNGNGQWAEETRVPANAAPTLCPAQGNMVKACDY